MLSSDTHTNVCAQTQPALSIFLEYLPPFQHTSFKHHTYSVTTLSKKNSLTLITNHSAVNLKYNLLLHSLKEELLLSYNLQC